MKNNTKIALVIGHDIDNQGAYGSEGISEYVFNKQLLSDILIGNKNLREDTVKVFNRDHRISGYSAQMTDLHKHIDEWGADISIELHFNSFSNENVKGHEILYCSQGGKHIAEILNDSLDSHLPTSNRGIKKVTMDDRGGGFCCRGKSFAIIIEPFFGSSQHRFVHGGDLREPLKRAIVEFLEQI